MKIGVLFHFLTGVTHEDLGSRFQTCYFELEVIFPFIINRKMLLSILSEDGKD